MSLWYRSQRLPKPFRPIPNHLDFFFFSVLPGQNGPGVPGFLETIPHGRGSLVEMIRMAVEENGHPVTEREKPMKEMALLLGILAVWVLLQSVVLPYLGVST